MGFYVYLNILFKNPSNFLVQEKYPKQTNRNAPIEAEKNKGM